MKNLDAKYIGMELSHATMREEDLIPDFMDFLNAVAEECEITEQVQAIQEEVDTLTLGEKTGYSEYYTEPALASEILDEDIFNLLNDIAPEFTYFGSSEGDGASFGFWTSDEALGDYIMGELDNVASTEQFRFVPDYQQVRAVCENILEKLNEHDR